MIHVLINQLARRGKGAKAARLIFRCFEELDVDYALVPGETLPEVKHNLQELVDRGAERIIVAGGDGIIHHAIQSIATTETVLGIIPIGTGNDFCRALAIPTGIKNINNFSIGDKKSANFIWMALESQNILNNIF